MYFKRAGKTIFDVDLNKAEEKVLDAKIRKTIAEYVRKHEMEEIAMVLYQLRKQLGFGPERLRRFFDKFYPEFDSLIKHYEMDEVETPWLCLHMLKQEGVDVEAWFEEAKEKT